MMNSKWGSSKTEVSFAAVPKIYNKSFVLLLFASNLLSLYKVVGLYHHGLRDRRGRTQYALYGGAKRRHPFHADPDPLPACKLCAAFDDRGNRVKRG